MSDEILIEVENLSKKFCRNLKKSLWYGVKDMSSELAGRSSQHHKLRPDEFWAVDDVSFQVRRGECLGLIGSNGAGKTTLLRMLNGLIKPDKGKITVRGRVGALIALGAGFNPILTGRENVYAAGAILGLATKEISEKYNAIVDFSELQEFMDTPVQNYSSGMRVRLGFAVATQMETDVLILDEILAVGDIGFTIKCLNMVRRLTRKTAVVFVSHNMQFISSFCTRVMVLEKGTTALDSTNPAEGIDRYYALVKHDVHKSGTGEAQVLGLDLIVDGQNVNEDEPTIKQGSLVIVMLQIHLNKLLPDANVLLFILDEAMAPIICVPVFSHESCMLNITPGTHNLKIPLGKMDLNSGKFSFVIVVRDAETLISRTRVQGLQPFRVISEQTYWGKIVRPVVTAIGTVE
jgi:lipopolysaccharide transport system ATP-binding protein